MAPRPPTRSLLVGVLVSLRPRQWTKNALVFAAPAAAGVLFEWPVLWRVVAAFAVFCAAASAVYLVNDVADAEADRQHPRKRSRPVAAGALPVPVAVAAAVVLATGSIVGGLLITPMLAGIVATYLVVSLSYSAGLKHVAVVDLLLVGSGFVLRAWAGAAAADIPVSPLFVTVMAFGALAMAAGKRSSELARAGDGAAGSRRVLASYTPGFLVQVETIAVGGALVGYLLWAFDVSEQAGGSPWVELSVVPFALALLRYLLSVSMGEAEAPEEALFADRVLAAAAVVWAGLFVAGVRG